MAAMKRSTMGLHARSHVGDDLDSTIHVGQDAGKELARFRFPTAVFTPEDAMQVIEDELLLDGNSRQNLATFCQTWEEDNVVALMHEGQDKNLIDKDEYRQHRGNLGHRLLGGLRAGRHGRQVALAGTTIRRG